MLWDVIGWRMTSIGGPSGAVDVKFQRNMLAFGTERSILHKNTLGVLKGKTGTYVLPQYWLSALCWEGCGQSCCMSTCEYCKRKLDAVRQCLPGCWLERCSWLCTCDPRCLSNRRFSLRPLSWKKKMKKESNCHVSRMHTWLVLVLNVIAGDDAVSIKPLDPAQVHASVFHLSHFQFRGIWRFCAMDGEDTRLTHQKIIFWCCCVTLHTSVRIPLKYGYVQYSACEINLAQWAEWVLDPLRKSWWHGRRRRQSRLAQQGLAVSTNNRHKGYKLPQNIKKGKRKNVKMLVFIADLYIIRIPKEKWTVTLRIIVQHKIWKF